jgi:hypothetical protein
LQAGRECWRGVSVSGTTLTATSWTRAAGFFAEFRAESKNTAPIWRPGLNYDVIIGLHPDDALREVVDSARVRPVVVVACCNFWLRDTKLGRDELLGAIEKHHAAYGTCERAVLDFRGPHNRVLVLRPARMA